MVEYDPEVISYEKLLKVFWSSHDPTTLNRQGPDDRHAVSLGHPLPQRRAAKGRPQVVSGTHGAPRVYRYPIVTQLVPMRAFYRAEDYHQDYYGGKPRSDGTRRAQDDRLPRPRNRRPRATSPSAPAETAEPTESPQAARRRSPDEIQVDRSRRRSAVVSRSTATSTDPTGCGSSASRRWPSWPRLLFRRQKDGLVRPAVKPLVDGGRHVPRRPSGRRSGRSAGRCRTRSGS